METPDPAPDAPSTASLKARELFIVSLVAMAAELMIIRWLACEVRVFAYFKNLPLMAAFLGLGLGCTRGSRQGWSTWFPMLLAAETSIIALAGPLGLTHLSFPGEFMYQWGTLPATSVAQAAYFLGVVLGLFLLTTAVFAAIGECVGNGFQSLPPLRAYSLNVGGNLLGLGIFAWLSWWQTEPAIWLAVVALAWLLVRPRISGVLALGLAIGLALSTQGGEIWSAYYRIDTATLVTDDVPPQPFSHIVNVNHEYHQRIIDLSDRFLTSHPALAASPFTTQALSTYGVPFKLAEGLDDVLVVGAGTGNDVAAALRFGAVHVDAVEIDRAIQDLGRRLHPEKPYDSPRVSAHVADARRFFRTTTSRYDLVVFGLLDSHTMFSSMSSLRLDNYVYTVESLRRALGLLSDRGLVALSFCVGPRIWMVERMGRTLAQAWGQAPLIVPMGYDGSYVFLAGPAVGPALRARVAKLGIKIFKGRESQVRVATDDWPFLYMNPNEWPLAYVLVLVLVLGVAFVLTRPGTNLTPGGRVSLSRVMFLLGAGFMLVEVRAVADLSLLYGSTWTVNMGVFAGILVMILGANAIVVRWGTGSLGRWYVGLLGCLLLLMPGLAPFWSTIPESLLVPARTLAACLPVLFSGVIFGTVFAKAPEAASALGANLFGALVGGCLEYVSMLTGIGSLSVLALVLYGLAWASTPRSSSD